jgi:hypothetical protein
MLEIQNKITAQKFPRLFFEAHLKYGQGEVEVVQGESPFDAVLL